MSLLTTLLEVAEILAKAEVEFLIGGSLASSVWGQERTTHDADIVAFIALPQLDAVDRLVCWPYVMDTDSMRANLEDLQDFACGQILNGETLDKIDLFLLGDQPYSKAQMANRRFIEVAPGHLLPFASPEDTVISKLRWFELGNRISDRQWNDIVQVLEMQAGELDDAYLNEWADSFGLFDLLEEARSQVSPGA